MNLRMRDFPENQRVGWWPLLFSVFIVFVFLDPLQRHASRLEWALTIIGVMVFLVLYGGSLVIWSRKGRGLWVVGAVTLLGVVFGPF